MDKRFQLSISNEQAAGHWGDKALLSYNEEGARVHLTGEDDLLRLQTAGRRLAASGIEHMELVGDGWSLENQWAVAQGAYDPKGVCHVKFADLPENEQWQLGHRLRVSHWLRGLVNQTPEELSPVVLAEEAARFIESFAKDHVSYEIIKGDDLDKAGLVGIHGVGRGSVRPPALLKLDFTPDGWGDKAPAAALVGKGITFDSGGYSIKPSAGMVSMKADMGGAATVAGALALAISEGLDKRVQLFLCCAENLISGHAYKLGDILTYKNGTSVEIQNTDTEGRLVLADGLLLAGESGAPLIIDAATLTGAAVTAVGEDYNAVFSLDADLQDKFLKFAEQEQENHWPLPLRPFHANKCPSNYADTANSRPVKGGGAGGASNAAGFLSRFVPNQGKGWLHVDLASAFRDSAGPVWSAGGTGHGFRTIARAIREL